MKIIFLMPVVKDRRYHQQCLKIVASLQKQGHTVDHRLSWDQGKIAVLTFEERQRLFEKFCQAINEAQLVIAECSFSSLQIGQPLSLALQQDKPIIALMNKNRAKPFQRRDPLLYLGNVHGCEYTDQNLIQSLKRSLKKLKSEFFLID